MNKIKIYFSGDWTYIAPPWTPLANPLKECSDNDHHDIGIDLRDGRAYVTNDDYYCNIDANEMKTLVKMLEIAIDIAEDPRGFIDLEYLKSQYPDSDVYVV
jgi:hypothetical protein